MLINKSINQKHTPMKTTVNQLAKTLQSEFAGRTFPACTRRNGKPSDGWSVIGHTGLTRAIKAAGLPWDKFWSGSLPTPSTQTPAEIVDFCQQYI